jgi:DNA-binding beta-propeller fold protein YncE
MMRRARRTAAVASVAACVLFGLLSTPSASANSAVSYFPLPVCCPMQEVQAGGGLVILVSEGAPKDHGDVLRLDPTTGAITAQLSLFADPAGNNNFANFFSSPKMAVAGGSVWFASYFENRVYRLNPVTLAVEDLVKTGRSPASLTYGGGALWVSLNNRHAVQRIDPASDAVTATIRVGNQHSPADQPSRVAWTGTQLLVSLPATGRVAHISRNGRHVTYDHVGAAAGYSLGRIDPVPGGYWLDDTDGDVIYRHWSYATHKITAHFRTPGGWSSLYTHGALYTGGARCDANYNCTQGLIQKHDATTGRLLARRLVGPVGAWFPYYAFGSLWTTDFNQLQRSALF